LGVRVPGPGVAFIPKGTIIGTVIKRQCVRNKVSTISSIHRHRQKTFHQQLANSFLTDEIATPELEDC